MIAHKSLPDINNWVAFDLEWEPILGSEMKQQGNINHCLHNSVPSKRNNYKIVTFGYEDVFGNRKVLDILNFQNYTNPDYEFLSSIQSKLLQYRYCFAWGSKAIAYENKQNNLVEGVDGDLVILDINLRSNGIPSIVKYDRFTGKPFISNYRPTAADIDLCLIYAKPLIRHVIFKNKYKSLRLQEVATALLGYGKLGGESGSAISRMTVDQRKAYCMHDAHLVTELVRINNGDIIRIMEIIATHTGLKLEEVCEKGMTGIWTKIMNEAIRKKINLIGYNNLSFPLRKLYSNLHLHSISDYKQMEEDIEEERDDTYVYDEEYSHNDKTNDQIDNWNSSPKYHFKERSSIDQFKRYRGATVLEPSRGVHHDVYVLDVTSLYPTMVVKYNLSPETVNCLCCKSDMKARDYITSEILDGCQHIPKEECYWICQRKRGLFARMLQELTQERIKYKNAGSELESRAIKAIINSGYGVFGHPHFKYYDPRVAELVTAFGRYTLTRMQTIAKKLGFIVLYGDTDSLFVNNIGNIDNINRFISECESDLGITVGHERTFAKLILTRKKHYIGIFPNAHCVPVIKGMEGIKSDRPVFIHKVFKQLVEDIEHDHNPIPNLRKALDNLSLKNVPSQELAITMDLRKNPEEYKHECKQNRLGRKLGLIKGMSLVYYKTHQEELFYEPGTNRCGRVYLESDNPDDISFAKYREMLFNSVKDVIEILGYDISQLSDTGKKRMMKDSVYFRRQ